MPSRPPYPLGLPLTESMEHTATDGTCWLAYIEGIPSPPQRRWRRQTLLPGRRLRFDSVSGSRTITPVPAGAPFLTEGRLQELLDRATPLELSTLGAAARPDPQRRSLRVAARAAGLAAPVLEAGVLAADRVMAWVAAFLSGRPRARL